MILEYFLISKYNLKSECAISYQFTKIKDYKKFETGVVNWAKIVNELLIL